MGWVVGLTWVCWPNAQHCIIPSNIITSSRLYLYKEIQSIIVTNSQFPGVTGTVRLARPVQLRQKTTVLRIVLNMLNTIYMPKAAQVRCYPVLANHFYYTRLDWSRLIAFLCSSNNFGYCNNSYLELCLIKVVYLYLLYYTLQLYFVQGKTILE
jgi:hypothetical protein